MATLISEWQLDDASTHSCKIQNGNGTCELKFFELPVQKSGRRNRNSFSGGPDDGLSGAQDAVRKLLDLKANKQFSS